MAPVGLSRAAAGRINHMRLIDTHCHLDLPAFDTDRAQVLQRTRDAGVSDLVIPGVSAARWPGLLALCEGDAGLHPALGLHPMFMSEHRPAHLQALPDWIEQHRPLAIGEIGLDFSDHQANGGTDHDAQLTLFEAQLDVARNFDLPVILHVRKAHDQVLHCLKRYQPPGGICHAFSGSQQQAEQYLALGFKLGFGGMLTYQRSSRLRRLAQELPLEALVLETDAPDMTVASHQYQRNSPEYLPEVLSALAEVRGMNEATVAAQTTANAGQVLAII